MKLWEKNVLVKHKMPLAEIKSKIMVIFLYKGHSVGHKVIVLGVS